MMDKIYEINHSKSLLKLKKFRGNESYFLPQIKSQNDNLSFPEFIKFFKNESPRNTNNDESKMNIIKQMNNSSLNNSLYDNIKDSGTSAIQK